MQRAAADAADQPGAAAGAGASRDSAPSSTPSEADDCTNTGSMDAVELKQKTFVAVFWSVIRAGATNVVSFIVFMVLARTLTPSEFGMFALALVLVEFARILSSAGLSDAIVRDKDHDEALADTAFWGNLALGCFVGAIIWLVAPSYARLVGQPAITPVVRWLAFLIPVASLSGIHTARKLAEFGHKAVAARMISVYALAGTAAVGAALAGFGVWSLVIQAAVADVVGLIFAWRTYPWLPRLRFDPRLLWRICGFSGSMMLTQLLSLLLSRTQDIVIGRYISAAAVGSYRVAWRVIDLISQVTLQPMVGVSFVTLSRLQDDPERFRSAFLRMLGLGALFTFPALAGFGVVAGALIPFLFGAKWITSVPIAQILTLMAVPFCMSFFVGPALAAIGRSSSIAKASLVQTAATLTLSLIAAPFGLPWVAAAFVLRAYLTMPYHLSLLSRDTGISAFAMLRAIAPPGFASFGMVACLYLLQPSMSAVLGNGPANLAATILAGCLAFAILLAICTPKYVKHSIMALPPIWRRRVAGSGDRPDD